MQFHVGGSTNLILNGELDIARVASENRNKGRTTWAKSKTAGQQIQPRGFGGPFIGGEGFKVVLEGT
jgi:hypothetical protein